MTARAHSMPFGAEPTEDGVRFALWAPTARDVVLEVDARAHVMPPADNGWRRVTIPEAAAGSRYAFRVDGGLRVPDPASRFQPDDVHGPSEVIDPRSFVWTDADWSGRRWEEAIVYEVHVGTFTADGTFAALSERLEGLRDLGVTAIELMPVADFPGRRSWGYDGVLPFAPDAAYGTTDDLKRLVDRAHGLGLMVLLDVVYNHFGPSGNYLNAYAGTFFTQRHHTPWGAGINFDGAGERAVREFFVHNALFWLEEYHVDGLRLDAVHAIADESERHILAEIAESARAVFPHRHVHLVLENDANEARWLQRDATGRPALHTAQWSDDVHHCWHVLLTGEREGYYEDYADHPVERLARALAHGFTYQGEPSRHRGGARRGERSTHLPPSAFVACLQNHDQVGNRAFGERLSQLVDPQRLRLARAALLLAPQIPMLFMGEEWEASTPFLYFVDFSEDEGLSNAVRQGRRQEFSRFAAFADPDVAARVPDPTAPESFRRSKLAWGEREQQPHADVIREMRGLLALRASEVVPLTMAPFAGADYSVTRAGLLRVTWRFEAGTLSFLANFGDGRAAPSVRPAGRVLWTGPAGSDAVVPEVLAPWSGCFIKGAPP